MFFVFFNSDIQVVEQDTPSRCPRFGRPLWMASNRFRLGKITLNMLYWYIGIVFFLLDTYSKFQSMLFRVCKIKVGKVTANIFITRKFILIVYLMKQ